MVMSSEKCCPIQWMEPSPLWGDYSRWIKLPEQSQIQTPMILRFENDNFMEELLAMLDQCPYRITEWEAQPETWRNPMPSPQPVFKEKPNQFQKRLYNGSKLIINNQTMLNKNNRLPSAQLSKISRKTSDLLPTLKLYQPAQSRYYLVASSLISKTTGFPDYRLKLRNSEKATFVVRAYVSGKDEEKNGEYAFITTSAGKAWKKVSSKNPSDDQNRVLISNEEQHSMFPMHYADYCNNNRQLLAGFIPVGKREEWMGAPEASGIMKDNIVNPVPSVEGGAGHLKNIFYADIIVPWRTLIEQAFNVKTSLSTDSDSFPNFSDRYKEDLAAADRARSLKTARDQIQTGSWYILLDFANFIVTNLPQIWKVLTKENQKSGLNAAEQQFIDLLEDTTLPPANMAALAIDHCASSKNPITENSMWDELKALWTLEEKIDDSDTNFSWDKYTDVLPEWINGEAFDIKDRSLFSKIRDIQKTKIWLTLLDISEYIKKYLPDLVKNALNILPTSRLISAEKKLKTIFTGLLRTDLDNLIDAIGVEDLFYKRITIKNSLAEALTEIKKHEENLGILTVPFTRETPPEDLSADDVMDEAVDPLWPDFIFPLADPDTGLETEESAVLPPVTVSTENLQPLDIMAEKLEVFTDLVDSLLPAPEISPERETDLSFNPLLDHRDTRFVIRCVFERPNCGPMFPAVLSRPSRMLEMAPFFDPDAPARQVRISLPMDISPSGLRKYKKNAMFLISDMLCGKIKKIKKITFADLVLSVLPWPFHKNLPSMGPTGPCKSKGKTIGMFCSISIPIVTLCALILMIIIVNLFNIFFGWIPYLFMCLPIPGFKGKDND